MKYAKPLLTLACAAALSGCVVAPYYPRQAYYPPPESVETDVPPPPPQVEVVPAVPFVGAIWLSGYWGWYGGRHRWVAGHWAAPRPGYGWTPRHWERAGGRWQLHGGWQRR